MYSIASGTTLGLADTSAFIDLLERLPEHLPRRQSQGFFDAARELYVTRAPGRLDLMGGIADYSGSLVLQLPIAAATHVALQLQREETLRVVSLSRAEDGAMREFEMPLRDFYRQESPADYATIAARFTREPRNSWAAYVAGAFLVLMRERGCEFGEGARMLVYSDVPEGKGVSSSAALEVAAMQAIRAAYAIELSPHEMAFLCQKVENMVACAPCGVMDQMTAACGEEGRLLALLCQPGELRGTVELPEQLEVWGIDSGIRHSVGGADYGSVRTAAFMGYRMIADMAGLRCRMTEREGVVSIDDPRWRGYLANISTAEFEESYASHLPERMSGTEFLECYGGITDTVTRVIPARRYHVRQATQHPIYEHARVTSFAAILDDMRAALNDTREATRAHEKLGELMYGAHRSYSSCGLGSAGTDELVRLVREFGAGEGLYGAKITGGGSGGTVAVLGRRGARRAVDAVAREYERRTHHAPLVISGSSPGAGVFGYLQLSGEN